MALRAAALLAAVPDPSGEQVTAALQPNICRCGCYPRISRAVHRAAELASESGQPEPEPEPEPEPAAARAMLAGPVLARPRRP